MVRARTAHRIDGIHAPDAARSRDVDQVPHQQAADAAPLPLWIDCHGAVATAAVLARAVLGGADFRLAVAAAGQRHECDLAYRIGACQITRDAFVGCPDQGDEAICAIFRRQTLQKRVLASGIAGTDRADSDDAAVTQALFPLERFWNDDGACRSGECVHERISSHRSTGLMRNEKKEDEKEVYTDR